MDTDLTLQQGATFRCQLVYRNPDGSPVDLSHWIVSFKIISDGVLLGSDTGAIELDVLASSGTINVRIGADHTGALPAGTLAYVAELTSDSDATEVVRLVEGALTVEYEAR